MKLLMISGSYPPESCGVGDYSEKLVSAIRLQGVEVEVFANIDWSFAKINKISKLIDQLKPDVIHVQFPSKGFGYGLIAQALTLKYKAIVTLHEVSAFHPVRKLWLLPFLVRSKLIFTTAYEYAYFKSIFPWYRSAGVVIPIGSNIDHGVGKLPGFYNRNLTTIISFGLIRPKKGLEDVIKLGQLIQDKKLPFKIKIIGQVFDTDMDYWIKLKDLATGLPVEWHTNLSAGEVSTEFAKSVVAYLPFPDGASERRGSLMAVLKHRLLAFTVKGDQTPADFDDLMCYTKTPNELADILTEWKEDDFYKKYSAVNQHMPFFDRKFSWDVIAASHIDLYKSFIKN